MLLTVVQQVSHACECTKVAAAASWTIYREGVYLLLACHEVDEGVGNVRGGDNTCTL